MLSQHKKEGVFSIKLNELKERLKLIDKKQELYPGWTAFEKTVLKIPQEEISSKTDISFTYEAIKTGKRFTDLKFYIREKAKQLSII